MAAALAGAGVLLADGLEVELPKQALSKAAPIVAAATARALRAENF